MYIDYINLFIHIDITIQCMCLPPGSFVEKYDGFILHVSLINTDDKTMN